MLLPGAGQFSFFEHSHWRRPEECAHVNYESFDNKRKASRWLLARIAVWTANVGYSDPPVAFKAF
jgi:hypothetical protein